MPESDNMKKDNENGEEPCALARYSYNFPYQSDLGWHSEQGVVKVLERLYELNPKTAEYWQLKADLLYCIAMNAQEQFSRAKYGAGMLTKGHFEKISSKLSKREESFGIEGLFF